MSVSCAERRAMARGETNVVSLDWGENTSGSETGALAAGDTLASCTVSLDSSPSGSTSPTLGSVAVNSSALVVNGRTCSAGEATTCTVTTGAGQVYGDYRLKFTGTTTAGLILPRFATVTVEPGR